MASTNSCISRSTRQFSKLVRGIPPHGVVVARVIKDSPAARAGLKPSSYEITVDGVGVPIGGDAIDAVDGHDVRTSQQLADLVASHKQGDRLELDVARGQQHRTVTVTLANVPAQGS